MRIEEGSLYTPFGTPYNGFKVTISDGFPDVASEEHAYASIQKVLDNNNVKYKTHKEHRPNGLFKSYSIET